MATGIGMFAMIMGLFIAVAGWQSKTGGVLGAGVLICGGGMSVGIFGNPSKDMPNGSPEMVAMGGIAIVIGIVILIVQIRKASTGSKKQAEVRLLEIGGTALDRFFVECVLAGV